MTETNGPGETRRPRDAVAAAAQLIKPLVEQTRGDAVLASDPGEAGALLEQIQSLAAPLPQLLANVANYLQRAGKDGHLQGTDQQQALAYVLQELEDAIEGAKTLMVKSGLAGHCAARDLTPR